jgi:lysozyme
MKEAIELIKHFEGCKLVAYQCSAKIWTIGFGSTFYENGAKVKQGDTITQARAESLLLITANKFAVEVRKLVKSNLNEKQMAALISFAFNLGMGALQKSTLLKLVNSNPSSPQIRNEFMKWVNAGGKPLNGLIRRRKAEADLYFS